MLITMPEKKTNAQKNITDFFERMKAKYGEGFVGKLTKEEEAERLRLKSNLENQPKNPPFKSSHWDEPSILEGSCMKKIKITITMTEQEAEWLEQACFVEEDFPHSKFLNRVSRVARRARHAFQQSVQSDECPHCHAKPAYTDQQTYPDICSECGTRR